MARDFGLRRLALLSGPDLEMLAEALETVQVPPGRIILTAGREADAAYVIAEGEVEILAGSDDQPTLISIERTGSVLGDVPILFQMPVPFDAVARTRCVLLRIEGSRLPDLLRECPPIALRWLGNVVKRLDRANRRILSLVAGDLRSRTLALLAEALGQQEAETATIRLTQSQLAGLLGVSRQTVNRVLGRLATEGLVRTSYGQLEILDGERILSLAG
jgi:CRP-like cAMP-binding protein